jgi:hypothetical protein
MSVALEQGTVISFIAKKKNEKKNKKKKTCPNYLDLS